MFCNKSIQKTAYQRWSEASKKEIDKYNHTEGPVTAKIREAHFFITLPGMIGIMGLLISCLLYIRLPESFFDARRFLIVSSSVVALSIITGLAIYYLHSRKHLKEIQGDTDESLLKKTEEAYIKFLIENQTKAVTRGQERLDKLKKELEVQ